ncbi:hypothetical protein M8C21_006568, partial [Ambrosia artemisiifolia]
VLETCLDRSISIIHLPFPSSIDGIPDGIESTDKLPLISLFPQFAVATKLMQPHFEQALNELANVTCIVSDGFLGWTLASANKFGIPRLSFYGMNAYASAVYHVVGVNRLFSGPESDDELITVPGLPWISITRNDFDYPFNQPDPSGPYFDFIFEAFSASANSYGMIMNSFYELEPLFIDYLNRESKPKIWCVGPLCLTEPLGMSDHKPNGSKWMAWLDQKLAQGSSVLYVAFGSQAEISTEQMEAISKGLEESEVSFLWVVRKCESSISYELGERVGERGMIVTEWVDQMEILKHESVNGFVSHCGWNSVLESICAEVPILAWPMMAEQPLNARMVVEEIKIGLRVETCDGSVKGLVKSDGLKKMIKELMEGEKGKEVRKKVKEVGVAAKVAVADGGSSWQTLNELINEMQNAKNFRMSDGEMFLCIRGYSLTTVEESILDIFPQGWVYISGHLGGPPLDKDVRSSVLYVAFGSANKFGIPRLSFYGTNAYASAVYHAVGVNRLFSGPESDDELITVPGLPWISITRNDFDYPFNQWDPSGPYFDFIFEAFIASSNSYGMIMNSFYELEPLFIDYLNRESKPKIWCVGPLCLTEPLGISDHKPNGSKWMAWLDQKLAQGNSVLYVAFGSQADISTEQMEEISKGLEESEVSFLWVVRKCESGISYELGERVGERGMIVTEWVDQMEILKHESVNGFVSHCGWNSVLESICAEVPILVWPMMAEQPLNARMVVKEVGATAKAAVAESGSSWRTLNDLVNEVRNARNSWKSNGGM